MSMSADPPSLNPFRRKAPPVASHGAGQGFEGRSSTSPPPLTPVNTTDAELPLPVATKSKIVKRVRVQSPPPLSPDSDSIPQPTPITIPNDDESFESKYPSIGTDYSSRSKDDSSDESEGSGSYSEHLGSSGAAAPANPFSKTLATLEQNEGDNGQTTSNSSYSGAGSARGAMDVDAFKRMLMTGSPAPTQPSSTQKPPQPSSPPPSRRGHGLTSDSSTDNSSISRHSISDALHDAQHDSPRSSHDISDDDIRPKQAENHGDSQEKKKPPPPSSRHGRLIKVELKDDGSEVVQQTPHTDRYPPRSPLDVHKPLPAAPMRTGHEADHESIFETTAAGKTPEPASPGVAAASASVRRRGPPAPPMRRHSQLVADSKLNNSSGRLSPNMEEDSKSLPPMARNDSASGITSPPPPPPTRRPTSLRNSSFGMPGSPGLVLSPGAPAPPPSRGSSVRKTNRPPSISGVDMSQKRSGATPPPPPPPRGRASSRNSMDMPAILSPGSARPSGEFRRTSGEFSRRSTESARRGSEASQVVVEEREDDRSPTGSRRPSDNRDVLGDLEKLQREIDALRQQGGRLDGPP